MIILVLTSPLRASALHRLDIRFMTIHHDRINFIFSEQHKICNRGLIWLITALSVLFRKVKSWDVSTIKVHLERTKTRQLESNETQHLISYIKPHKNYPLKLFLTALTMRYSWQVLAQMFSSTIQADHSHHLILVQQELK